jgi:C4-dicarboxylate transporter DctM subunit
MGIAAFLSIFISGSLPAIIVPQRIFVAVDSFSMLAIPLFILAGELMNGGGITTKIVNFSRSLVGHIKGGLAQVNILASIFFAGISGTAAADSASLGAMLIPAMEKDGYDTDFAVAVTACSSCVGPIIPPSVVMIIYGSISGESIGRLFMGGLIPGLIMGIGMMVVAYVISVKRDYKSYKKATCKEIWISFKSSIVALVMPLIIMGGILSGIFTTTEAGVVAVVYGLIVGLVTKEIKLKDIKGLFVRTGVTSSVVMFVIGSAQIVGWLLARERFPQMIVAALLSVSSNPVIILTLILLFLFVLGFVMDGTAALIILVPVLMPVIQQYGFDPIQFAVCMCMILIAGAVTPPVGTMLFITCGIAQISITDVTKAITPFLSVIIVTIFACAYIPSLVTFLPNLLM